MAIRRSHYEMAFEAYLARRGTPYVAIEDVKHEAKAHSAAKLFDYIVYPTGGKACLVDVKGRKTRRSLTAGDIQWSTWVTQGDLDGLQIWGDIFGPNYVPQFAFVYWITGEEPLFPPEGDETFIFAGRRYCFWLVTLADYLKHQRSQSVRWKTVWVPAESFQTISKRLEKMWPSAPC